MLITINKIVSIPDFTKHSFDAKAVCSMIPYEQAATRFQIFYIQHETPEIKAFMHVAKCEQLKHFPIKVNN